MGSQSPRRAGTTSVDAVEEALGVLRSRIFSGRLRPGDRLAQEALSAEIGIGRTPLREALRQLEQEGLAFVDRDRSAYVVPATPDRVIALVQVREVVEGLAARLAAQSPRRRTWVSRLDALLSQQRRALDPWQSQRYRRAVVDFVETIAFMSENQFVVDRCGLVGRSLLVFSDATSLGPDVAQRWTTELEGVRHAIADGDGDAAEQRCRTHVAAQIHDWFLD